MDFWTSNWGTGESKILLNIRIAKKAKPCWNVEILKFASVSIYVGNVEHDCKCCLKSLTCCSNCWKCIWKVVENQNVKIILKQCGSRATDLVSICCLWNFTFWNNGPKKTQEFSMFESAEIPQSFKIAFECWGSKMFQCRVKNVQTKASRRKTSRQKHRSEKCRGKNVQAKASKKHDNTRQSTKNQDKIRRNTTNLDRKLGR